MIITITLGEAVFYVLVLVALGIVLGTTFQPDWAQRLWEVLDDLLGYGDDPAPPEAPRAPYDWESDDLQRS